MVAVGEVDIALVEDGRPLERGAVETLAGVAVTVFRDQRPLAAQLEPDPPTVAASLPLDGEVPVGLVDAVGLTVLPRVQVAVRGRASLVLVCLTCGLGLTDLFVMVPV